MARTRRRPEQIVLGELHDRLAHFGTLTPSLSRPAAKKAMEELRALMEKIERTHADLDPIKDPGASFDPTDPDTAGRLVALALIAQNRVPLGKIARTYGSGVYALYYSGDHPAYAAVSGTETPIYVGKADPQTPNARTSREQGPQLFGRLKDHRRMINTVSKYATDQSIPNALRIEDFECRRLVCATNAQLVAENHLIGTFKPIWNKEIGTCWGISKHGDSASTRGNKRSPWDVMHLGRAWAMDESLEDQMSPQAILERIAAHFEAVPPYRDRDVIVLDILKAFIQNVALTDVLESDDVDSEVGDAAE